MHIKRSIARLTLAAVAALGGLQGTSEAASFGIYSTNAGAATAGASVATGLGHTASVLSALTAADLAGLDVLWILNPDNNGYDAQITGNTAAVSAFVAAGGVLSFHDRHVERAETVLPGAATTNFVRSFANDANIDLEPTAPALIVAGPGGAINNATLDGGTSSNHGYAVEGTLPAGATTVFNVGIDTQIVDFFYPFGLGAVYYSTIPLDYYLGGAGAQPNFAGIYAENEAAFQASLAAVPEPLTLVLLGVAGAGFTVRRRLIRN